MGEGELSSDFWLRKPKKGEKPQCLEKEQMIAPCRSLSLGERVRVRGNGVKSDPAYQTFPGTGELNETSREAGDSLN